ncbi:MAG: hypothetical protein GXY83_15470 [Rhodopirellula sp.]|nr:hypothetical protein [Rhodopirellula sp.]
MNYWIFKVSDQIAYPDRPGREYVYDNTHSVRVAEGDEFLYLEKAGAKYGLTGAGAVCRVTRRAASRKEQHSAKVDRIFTAHLVDVVWFAARFDLAIRTSTGRRNRRAVGLPGDLNSIGWSISMPRIERELFVRLLDAALKVGPLQGARLDEVHRTDWRVDDSWSLVRRRSRMQVFRAAVLARHDCTCVVCGTQLASVLDAAHIQSYAAHPEQRGNPANGLCLCSYCHAAYDSGDLAILPDGSLHFSEGLQDDVALKHFTSVSPNTRRDWLGGVDKDFLLERVVGK